MLLSPFLLMRGRLPFVRYILLSASCFAFHGMAACVSEAGLMVHCVVGIGSFRVLKRLSIS